MAKAKKAAQAASPKWGGARDGSGPKKKRTRKKKYTFALFAQTMHSLNRFAKARNLNRTAALETLVEEHIDSIVHPEKLWTWAGEHRQMFGVEKT